MLFHNICYVPPFRYSDVPFDTTQIQYLVAGWPQVICSGIIAWITAFVSFERCLCITLPLKVRSLITRRRTAVTMISLFLILATSGMPVYFTTSFGWKFNAERNKTIVGLIFINQEKRMAIENVSFAINNVLVPLTSYLCVSACTSVLVIKLKQKAQWRNENSSGKAFNGQTRDHRAARMIVLICAMFIACFLPSTVMFAAMAADPRFDIYHGEYRNFTKTLFSFSCVSKPLNSSVSAAIYFKMSSKYRETLKILLTRSHQQC